MTPNFDVKLPFTFASDNEQLEKDVLEFDKEKYDVVLDKFHEKIGLVFDGCASTKLSEIIEEMMN